MTDAATRSKPLCLEEIVAEVFDPAWTDYLPEAVKALEPYRERLEAATSTAYEATTADLNARRQALTEEMTERAKALSEQVRQVQQAAEDELGRLQVEHEERLALIETDGVRQLHGVPAEVWNVVHDEDPDVHRILVDLTDTLTHRPDSVPR